MSDNIIKDGTGTGKSLKIDEQNRAHTHAIIETLSQNGSRDGNSYNINTGTIVLTSATISELLYIENTGDNDLHVSTIGYLMGGSTGGSGDIVLGVNKNLTGGTLVSLATAPTINENKNVGSKKTLDANIYKGDEGTTGTGGNAFYSTIVGISPKTYIVNTGDIVIPRGGNISLNITPPTGNTSMNVQLFLAVEEYTLN